MTDIDTSKYVLQFELLRQRGDAEHASIDIVLHRGMYGVKVEDIAISDTDALRIIEALQVLDDLVGKADTKTQGE